MNNKYIAIAPVRRIIIVLCAALVLSVYWTILFPASGTFVVDLAVENGEFTDYRFCPTSGSGAFWLHTEHGAYHIGDTIVICKKN